MDQAPDDWLLAARAGSHDALGHALEACRRYLLDIASQEIDPRLRNKCGASDLVQETFLEAQRDFERFHGGSTSELRAWLRQLLLHHLYKVGRRYRATQKRAADREVALDPAAEAGGRTATPSAQAMAREEADGLQQALGRLPDDYRRVIVWRYQEQCPFDEIARRLGRTETAARKVWARAVERLQQEMKAS